MGNKSSVLKKRNGKISSKRGGARTTTSKRTRGKTSSSSSTSTTTPRTNQQSTQVTQSNNLPKLPLPSLSDTCSRFLTTVKPLLTPDEFQTTKDSVEEFLASDGPELQMQLEEYNMSCGEQGSYVADAWNESYLLSEASLCINVNPYFVLEHGPDPATRNSQSKRAAELLESALRFALSVRLDKLPPDIVKGQQLDMTQYFHLFNSTRIPINPDTDTIGDRFASFNYKDAPNSTRHCVVLCAGQIYSFNVFSPDGNSIGISSSDLMANLNGILQCAQDNSNQKTTPSIGICTAAPRREWGTLRHQLGQISQRNSKILEMIDSAVLVLCLDDTDTVDDDYIVREALCGSSAAENGSHCNRWFDKLQLIVQSNGEALVNFEHSAVDGHTVLRFAADISADCVVRYAQKLAGKRSARSQLKSYRATKPLELSTSEQNDYNVVKLTFDTTQSINDSIIDQIKRSAETLNCIKCGALQYAGFGMDQIKSWGISPDAFVQMAMLTAYYHVLRAKGWIQDGVLPNTYESVMTKRFALGRTEAGRSATLKALELVLAVEQVWSKAQSGAMNSKESNRIVDCLKLATQVHCDMIKACSNGHGVDRHLFALRNISLKSSKQVHNVFSSPGYQRLSDTMLSTSNCGNPSLRYFGFGPVSENGVGVGYIIRDDRLQFTFSSWVMACDEFMHALESCLTMFQCASNLGSSRYSASRKSENAERHSKRDKTMRVRSLVV